MISTHLQEYALQKYESRKKHYAPLEEELNKGFAGCSQEEAHLMRFFYGTMPLRDAGEYSFETFLSYVRHSLWLRENVEWCKNLPEDIFVHHVLYYRINSEDISDCRSFFYGRLKDRIAGMSLREAVMEINYWCAENAVYESTDGRTAAPMTMYQCGKGRCGEESTFAVSVYRSMGIPARQVYTPRWAHCDDNHAWVEVYLDGAWYFLGACEPEAVLNKGWFSGPASRGILIHSRTFSDFVSNPTEACIGKEDLLIYYNNTSLYAKVKDLTVRVKDEKGNPVQGACVAIEILNMAEYFPAAVMETDEQGEVKITLGIGDVQVRAYDADNFVEQVVSVADVSVAELILKFRTPAEIATDEWKQTRLTAPTEYAMHPGSQTAEQRQENERRVAEANQMRENRFVTAYETAAKYPEEEVILRTAGNHYEEILAFLNKDDNPNRKRLLHSLVPKDYKDLKACVLEDHVNCEQGEWSDEIFVNDLLCPRVYLEELTCFRSYINAYFSEEKKAAFAADPDAVWTYIRANIRYTQELDYKTVCATPVGCLKMKEGNLLAQKILFVAILRTLGVPARLNRVTMTPEYYKDGEFVVPAGLMLSTDGKKKAELTLHVADGGRWTYYQTWTIGRLTGAGFVTLDYEGVGFDGNSLTLHLEDGIYRVITTLRMPSGDQHVSSIVFALGAGEHRSMEMVLWEIGVEEMLVDRPIADFTLTDEAGCGHTLRELGKDKTLVLGFLGVGAEPTEHVLNELMDQATAWNRAGAEMIAVLRKPEDRNHRTLCKTLEKVNGIGLYYDNGSNVERVARAFSLDPEKLPVLTVLTDGRTGIYSCAGYNVGSVDLMLKIRSKKEEKASI